MRWNDRACASALPDAVWNESILVDRRRTSIAAGRARDILVDDPSGEQLLGQGRCHVGTGLHLLLYLAWSAHGRLDGTAQYLGTFARRYILVRDAQPALDSRGYVFHRKQNVRAAGGLKCVPMVTRTAWQLWAVAQRDSNPRSGRERGASSTGGCRAFKSRAAPAP